MDIYGKEEQLKGDKSFIPFRFQGQYLDSETDLYYNRFRYYSPETGSYISQDPIGLAGNNPTLYGYVSDVNSEVDVFGLNIFDYLRNGGLTFDEYKALRGGTRTLDFIETTNKAGKKFCKELVQSIIMYLFHSVSKEDLIYQIGLLIID